MIIIKPYNAMFDIIKLNQNQKENIDGISTSQMTCLESGPNVFMNIMTKV